MSAPIICGNPSCSLAQTRQIAWQFAGFFMALFTTKKERSQCFRIDFFPFWQGQEDSNPRPTVLETGTLPAELYPYARTNRMIRPLFLLVGL